MEFKLKMQIIAGVAVLAVIGILVFTFTGGKTEDSKTEATVVQSPQVKDTTQGTTKVTSNTVPKQLSTKKVTKLKPKTPPKPIINEPENPIGGSTPPLADSEDGDTTQNQNSSLNASSTANTNTASTTGANTITSSTIGANTFDALKTGANAPKKPAEELDNESDVADEDNDSPKESDKESENDLTHEEEREDDENPLPSPLNENHEDEDQETTESRSVLIDAGLSKSKREIISIHQIQQLNDPDNDTFLFWIRKDLSGTTATYSYLPIEALEAYIKRIVEPPLDVNIERAMVYFERERTKSFANGKQYDVALIGEGFNISDGTGYARYLKYSEESVKQKMLEIASKPQNEMLAALKAYLFRGRLVNPVDWNKDNLKLSIVVKIPKAKHDASGFDEEVIVDSASDAPLDAVQESVDPAKVPIAEESDAADAVAESLIKDKETFSESEDDEPTTLTGRLSSFLTRKMVDSLGYGDYYDESDQEEPDLSVSDEQTSILNEVLVDSVDALDMDSSISMNATDQDSIASLSENHELLVDSEVLQENSTEAEEAINSVSDDDVPDLIDLVQQECTVIDAPIEYNAELDGTANVFEDTELDIVTPAAVSAYNEADDDTVETKPALSELAPTSLIGKATGFFRENIFNPISDYLHYDIDSDVSDEEDEDDKSDYETKTDVEYEANAQGIVVDSTLVQEENDHEESDETLEVHESAAVQDQYLSATNLVQDYDQYMATEFIPQCATRDAETSSDEGTTENSFTGIDPADPKPTEEDELFGTDNFENWPVDEQQQASVSASPSAGASPSASASASVSASACSGAVALNSDSETEEEEEKVQSSDNNELVSAAIKTIDSSDENPDERIDGSAPLEDEPITQNAWNAYDDHVFDMVQEAAQEKAEEVSVFDYDSLVTGYEGVQVESDQENYHDVKQETSFNYDSPHDYVESMEPAEETVLDSEEISSETKYDIANEEGQAQVLYNDLDEGLDMARMFYPDSLDTDVEEDESHYTDSEHDEEDAVTARADEYADDQQEPLDGFDSQYIGDVPNSPYMYAAGSLLDGSATNGYVPEYNSYSDQLRNDQNTFSLGAPQDYLDITGKVPLVEETFVEQSKPEPEPNIPLKSESVEDVEPIASDNLFEYKLIGAEQYAKGGSEAKYKAAYEITKSSRYKEAYLFTLYKQSETSEKIQPEVIDDLSKVLVPNEELMENIKSSTLKDNDDERFQVISANSKTYFVYMSGTGFNYGYTYAGIANELVKYLSEGNKEDIYDKFMAYTNSGYLRTPFHLNDPDVQILITVQ